MTLKKCIRDHLRKSKIPNFSGGALPPDPPSTSASRGARGPRSTFNSFRRVCTPNISTGDGGVHRHQAIVPFLLYDTTTKSRGLQLHIIERRHFTTATPFRVRAMWIYSADRTCCCQSPFPSLQLLAALTPSLVSYGVVTLRISHNEFHCRTSFSHPFCLEMLFVAPIIL